LAAAVVAFLRTISKTATAQVTHEFIGRCCSVFLSFQGLVAVGGFGRMWQISNAGGRIIFFKYVLEL